MKKHPIKICTLSTQCCGRKNQAKTDETDEKRTNNKISQTQNENKVSGRGHKRRRSGSEPLKHLALNGADAEKGNKV